MSAHAVEERVRSFLKSDENYSKFQYDGPIFEEIVSWAVEKVREGTYVLPEVNPFAEDSDEEIEQQPKRIKAE